MFHNLSSAVSHTDFARLSTGRGLTAFQRPFKNNTTGVCFRLRDVCMCMCERVSFSCARKPLFCLHHAYHLFPLTYVKDASQ